MSEVDSPAPTVAPDLVNDIADTRSVDASVVNAKTRKKNNKSSRIWFDVHSWVGFKLSLFMSFVLITGTFAVVSNDLDWLANSSIRVTPQAATDKASWGEIYKSLQKQYPEWQFPYIREPVDSWFAVYVQARTPDGKLRLVDVNPYTAQVQGDRAWLSFQRFFRNSHRHLMLPTSIGVPLVSALAFLLLISLVSGLIVYKKFWRGFFKVPRRQHGRRVFYGDLHRLMSLWSLWFVLLIALTSVFYFAESLGWRAPPFGKIDKAEVVEYDLDARAIDSFAERAQSLLPGFRIALFLPPQKAGDPLIFQGFPDDGAALVRARASYVAFDPHSGDVLGRHHSADANVHQRIAEMADPLHFGSFGGLPIRIIWFVFGALLSALAITGIVIYATRIKKSILQSDSGLLIAWQGMGWWKWAGVAAVIVVIVLLPETANALNH